MHGLRPPPNSFDVAWHKMGSWPSVRVTKGTGSDASDAQKCTLNADKLWTLAIDVASAMKLSHPKWTRRELQSVSMRWEAAHDKLSAWGLLCRDQTLFLALETQIMSIVVAKEAGFQSKSGCEILLLPMALQTHHVQSTGRDTNLLYFVVHCGSHLWHTLIWPVDNGRNAFLTHFKS